MTYFVKRIAPLLSVTLLVACSSHMMGFKAKHDFQDESGEDTALLKLTTNVNQVWVIPNSSCLKLTEQTVNLRDKYLPARKDKVSIFSSLPLKEFNEKSLGMKAIPIEELQKQFNDLITDTTYSSTEHRIKADQPLSIFMPTEGGGLVEGITAIFGDDGTAWSFGATFTPQKNREYQLILNKNVSGQYVYYSGLILDITDSSIVNITPLAARPRPCKN